MKGFSLTPKKVAQLRKLHKQQRDRRSAYRINAIILLGTGWTLSEVSDALLLDTETLRGYVKKYSDGKVEHLLADNYQGRVGRLSEEQKKSLKDHLSEYTYMDVKSILAYVKKTYDVKFQLTRMREILSELGFTYKKPKLVPGRSDPVESMKFLQLYEELRRSGKPLYFMDGVHPQHNSQPSYGWILKGHEKALLSNNGRQRLNINGAVNIENYQLITTVDTSVNAQSTIALFKKILNKHKSEDKVYVICDNAGYYRSNLVKDFIKEHKKLEVIFLPPYSPFLNLIERVWKYFKKMVVYNRYYPTFSEFKIKCLKFFKRKHKRAFRKILVEKFHFSGKIFGQLKPIFNSG